MVHIRLEVLAAQETVAVLISARDSCLDILPLSGVEDSMVAVVYRGSDSKVESLPAARG